MKFSDLLDALTKTKGYEVVLTVRSGNAIGERHGVLVYVSKKMCTIARHKSGNLARIRTSDILEVRV